MKVELLEIISRIPYGKVTSYGKVAEQLDIQYNIKTSGYIIGRLLSGMSDEECFIYPWQRVINKQGYISTLKLGTKGLIHKQLLDKEGIEIINDTVDMKKYGFVWK